MQENSTRSSEQDCIDVIDKLHEMAHAGAFRNMDAGIISKCTKMLCVLFDVNVTIDDASKILNRPKSHIYDAIYRKVPSKDKPKTIKVMPFSMIRKLFQVKD